jgi:hypothetical protein
MREVRAEQLRHLAVTDDHESPGHFLSPLRAAFNRLPQCRLPAVAEAKGGGPGNPIDAETIRFGGAPCRTLNRL